MRLEKTINLKIGENNVRIFLVPAYALLALLSPCRQAFNFELTGNVLFHSTGISKKTSQFF